MSTSTEPGRRGSRWGGELFAGSSDRLAAWAAPGALLFAWAAGGFLVAGAAREAARPAAPWLFHLGALGVGLGLALLRVREARRSASAPTGARDARLAAAFRELGAGDLQGAEAAGRALPEEIRAAWSRALAGVGGRIERLQESSLAVAGAAENVDQSLGSLAAGASEQAAAAGEVTAAMEELSRTAARIAEHAEGQSQLTLRAEADGLAGAGALGEAVAGLSVVELRIGDVTTRADTLGNRSREIFRVLELIADIAHETHLLSLNAALEAAAAGDRGRRFAVVAGEVRLLAVRVRDSVTAVRSQVEEFASAIRAAVVATEEGAKEVARVHSEAGAASEALESLRAALAESATASRQISLVTRQQTAASQEVVATLRELHQVVERMSRDLGDLGRTARRLRDVGLDLQLQAQAFRLDSSRSLKHRVGLWGERLSGLAGAGPGEALAELVAAAPFVEAGYLADAFGQLVAIRLGGRFAAGTAGVADELRRVDMRERPWYRAAVDAGRAVVMPPTRSLLSGEPCLTIAMPRFEAASASGQLLGVIGFDVNLRHWTEIGQ